MSTNSFARNADASFRMTRRNEDVPEEVISSLFGRGLGYNDWKSELEQQGYGYAWTKSLKFRIIKSEYVFFREEIQRLQSEENKGGSKSKSNSLESILKRLKGEVWIEGFPDEREQRKQDFRLLGKDAKARCLQLHASKWGPQGSSAVPSRLLTSWDQNPSSPSPPSLSDETEPLNGFQLATSTEREFAGPLATPYMDDFQSFPALDNYYGEGFTNPVAGRLSTNSSYLTPGLDPSRDSSNYEPSISDVTANLSLDTDYGIMDWSQCDEIGDCNIWKTNSSAENCFQDHRNMSESRPLLEGKFREGGMNSQYTLLPDTLQEPYRDSNDTNAYHDTTHSYEPLLSNIQRKPVNGLLGTPNHSRQSSRSYHGTMNDSPETVSLGGSTSGRSRSGDGPDGRRQRDTYSIRGRTITKLKQDLGNARGQLERKDRELQSERQAKEEAEANVQDLLEKVHQLQNAIQKTFENSAELIINAPGQRQPTQRMAYNPNANPRGPEFRAGVHQTEHHAVSFSRALPIRMGSGGTCTSSQCNSPISPNPKKSELHLPSQSPTQGSFSRLIGKFSPKCSHKKMREDKNDQGQNSARSAEPQKKTTNDSVLFYMGGNGDW